MKDKPSILFAGGASLVLGEAIARVAHTGIHLGSIFHHQFPSGEFFCQYKENIRGDDVFLLQAICEPANDNLMQLLIMADAARRASAGRITAVVPYLGYSRQDRKDKSRVPISAKLVMDMFKAAGINRVMTMDLHAAQIAGFTNLPFDHLYFQPTLAQAVKDLDIQVVVAPDIGAVKKASEYATRENLDLGFIVKKRKNDTDVEVTQFVGDVKGKNVLVLDDLTESAGTIVMAANCCKNNDAKKVYAAVTHACISEVGRNRLREAFTKGVIDKFYCSNTVTEEWLGNEYASVVSVADVFAKAIYGIHMDKSITELFK